jgi:nitronate monooxygenase
MIKTRITELFGIKHPIIMGGLQHLGIPKFSSIVSNAGGMGTINITCYKTPEEFHESLKEMKSLTDKPYIVNISLTPDMTRDEATFKYIDICAKEGVPAIETAGADPSAYMPMFKEAGIKHIHKTPNARVAKRMEEKGADVITIAGTEVAGHPSVDGVGTFVIANKTASVCSIPVLAAGGVADGKGLAAALALGAEGVVIGTCLLTTTECTVHDNHKKYVLDHSETDTVLIQRSINNMMRVANNMTAQLILAKEARGTTLQELMPIISGKLSKAAYQTGNLDGSVYAAGMAMGLINEIKPVQQLLDDMVKEAEEVINAIKGKIW